MKITTVSGQITRNCFIFGANCSLCLNYKSINPKIINKGIDRFIICWGKMKEFIDSHSTLLSVLAGFLISLPLMKDKTEGTGIKSFLHLSLTCLVLSVISGAAALLFAALENYITSKTVFNGAVSTFGIFLISPLILFLILMGNKRKSAFFDMYAFYIIPSMVIQRIRCFIEGCCYGKQIFNTQLKYPTRESEIIFYIWMWFVLIRKKKENRTGSLFPLFMVYYGVFRFINEFFRYSDTNALFHLTHIWALISIVVGLSIYGEFRK